jgi:hypothetical protein
LSSSIASKASATSITNIGSVSHLLAHNGGLFTVTGLVFFFFFCWGCVKQGQWEGRQSRFGCGDSCTKAS